MSWDVTPEQAVALIAPGVYEIFDKCWAYREMDMPVPQEMSRMVSWKGNTINFNAYVGTHKLELTICRLDNHESAEAFMKWWRENTPRFKRLIDIHLSFVLEKS